MNYNNNIIICRVMLSARDFPFHILIGLRFVRRLRVNRYFQNDFCLKHLPLFSPAKISCHGKLNYILRCAFVVVVFACKCDYMTNRGVRTYAKLDLKKNRCTAHMADGKIHFALFSTVKMYE